MRRTKHRLFAGVLLLLTLAVATPSAYAQGGIEGQPPGERRVPCVQKIDFPQPFYERVAGPPGRWSTAYLVEQTASPIVITGITGRAGPQPGREKGLAITCAKLKNGSGKAVSEVRLSWVLTTREDRRTVMLRGELPPLGVRLADGEEREVEFDYVFFSEISRPLVAGGTLDGDYYWVFRVSGVMYEDGSAWAEPAT